MTSPTHSISSAVCSVCEPGVKHVRMPGTCVSPDGSFLYGIHKPHFRIDNFRENDTICCLGVTEGGCPRENQENFPPDHVEETRAEWIYEIPNPFPFRGASYIIKSQADRNARNSAAIGLSPKPPVSFSGAIREWTVHAGEEGRLDDLFARLPETVLMALAATSTDTEELVRIADLCATFVRNSETGRPTGLFYEKNGEGWRPQITRHTLYEVVANNPFLPDDYKRVMVLRPGVQGNSEIVGEWRDGRCRSHVFEYLRRNSYIPWGHFAANMADDAVRYRAADLTETDIRGMRHLYYQRTYTRLAAELGIASSIRRSLLSAAALETLRKRILKTLTRKRETCENPSFTATLWGWNFGFDFSPSGYRLHASHQQIHQQYALIPDALDAPDGATKGFRPFAYGDLIARFARDFREKTGAPFFDTYLRAIRSNRRMTHAAEGDHRLVIYEDDHIVLFAPKAQTSQWELQLMTVGPVGNILEADAATRQSLDRAMFLAIQTLERMGARLVTHIEASKRFDSEDEDQRLLYCFMPRLPYSPGSFTETQLRWIGNHYPEDFAAVCRRHLAELSAVQPDHGG